MELGQARPPALRCRPIFLSTGRHLPSRGQSRIVGCIWQQESFRIVGASGACDWSTVVAVPSWLWSPHRHRPSLTWSLLHAPPWSHVVPIVDGDRTTDPPSSVVTKSRTPSLAQVQVICPVVRTPIGALSSFHTSSPIFYFLIVDLIANNVI
jgi:hypothetical protein